MALTPTPSTSAVTRLRKTDFPVTVLTATLPLQQVHGASNRAYWLKQALVAAGWTVYYSSNGSVSSTTTDLWTTSGFQAVILQSYSGSAVNTATMDSIWCCLRSPYIDAKNDYLHICLSPSQAQWYDPTVRGINNTMSTYGVPAKASTAQNWILGQYHGFLRLGMTLSSSATAFTGGTVYTASTTDYTVIMGALPTATGAFWTTHNMGQGTGILNGFCRGMTVVTEGNQFHVLTDSGAGGNAAAGYR